MKRLLSVICVLALVVALMAGPAQAVDPVVTGQIGDNAYYEWNRDTGDLVVSGEGALWDMAYYSYDATEEKPFPAYRSGLVRRLIVEEGITEIGNSAFKDCRDLWDLKLPATLQSIGRFAFAGCSALKRAVFPENLNALEFHAFYGCNALTAAYFTGPMPAFCPDIRPEDVTVGDYDPFSHCGDGMTLYYLQEDPGWVWQDNRYHDVQRLYTDLLPGKWYNESIMDAHRLGLMEGVGNGLFAPNAQTTRAMLPQVLYRLAVQRDSAEPPASNPFADVPADAWFAEAVCWAAENGIVQGVGEEQFAPGNALTREQVAVMLYRFARYMELDLTADAALTGFSDAGQVSSWAGQGVRWAVTQGLMEGSDGKLNPQGTATRAQLAALLVRMHDVFGMGAPLKTIDFMIVSNGDYTLTNSKGSVMRFHQDGRRITGDLVPLEWDVEAIPTLERVEVFTDPTYSYVFPYDTYRFEAEGTESCFWCTSPEYFMRCDGVNIDEVLVLPEGITAIGVNMEYFASTGFEAGKWSGENYSIDITGSGETRLTMEEDEAGNIILNAKTGTMHIEVESHATWTIVLSGDYTGRVMITASDTAAEGVEIVPMPDRTAER